MDQVARAWSADQSLIVQDSAGGKGRAFYRCRPPRSVTMRALRRPPLAWTRHPAARRGAPAPKRTAMSTQDNWYIERFEPTGSAIGYRSEEHTSELQSRENLVCRLLLEKKK